MEKQQLSVDDDLLPIYYVHSDIRKQTFSSVWQGQEASAPSPSPNYFSSFTENCMPPAPLRTENPVLNTLEHQAQDEATNLGFATGTNFEVCCTKKDYSTVQKETASAFHQSHNATSTKNQVSATVKSSSAQDVFLSSLLQVQLCVMDLQDQIDITETSHKAREMNLNINPPSVWEPTRSLSSIQEPQISLPSIQKVDGDLEHQELDEDQDSDGTAYSELEVEDEGLFCDNPLFMNSDMDYMLQHNVHTASSALTLEHKPCLIKTECKGRQLLKQSVCNSTVKGTSTAVWQQITREESLEELQIYEDEWEEKTVAFNSTRTSGRSADSSLPLSWELPPCLEDPPAEIAKDNCLPDTPVISPSQEALVEEAGLLFSESSYWTKLLLEDEESGHHDQPSHNQPCTPQTQEETGEEILPELCQDESQHSVCQGCQGKEHGVDVLPLENGEQEMQSKLQPNIPEIVIDQLDDVSTDLETSGSEETTYVEAVASLQDVEAARCLAVKLFHLDGFDRSQVAPYLQKNNDFSAMVAEEYLALFDFTGKPLDTALRSLLQELVLTGETQERERVLYHFSKRFHSCNPKEFSSADAVHTLTCAIMLLNSDLHGQNIGKSMTAHDFISNLEGMNDGGNFPRELLKELYHSIRMDKLEWAVSEAKLANVLISRPENLLSVRKKSNPFVDIPLPDPQAPVYKQGTLCRKIHAAIDGKKTPWGKRGWKSFHTVLKGMLLFSFKDEYRSDFQFPEEVISVHHALAERASEYTKRPNVFRLQTADWRVFLFQAQTSEEMNSWISRVNLVAAMFSSPPFPSAVGSQRKFYRPILPSAPSKLDLEEQLQSHESLMDRFTDNLTEHQRNLPDPKSKARDWEDYHLREEYLKYEKFRYETYVKLLAVRMESSCEDLQVFESRLKAPDGVEGENEGLKRSYSSPSLNPENSPLVKVKRNISERRTYRRIIPKRNKNLV